jgi:N6-adenosine-specific RNA methylase IME4
MPAEWLKLCDLHVSKSFSGLIPETSEREQIAFAEEIKARGQLVPILATKDGMILDGHRRLAALKRIGAEKALVDRQGFESQDRDWLKTVAIAANLMRRHFNEGQRVALGTSLERMEKPLAEARKLEGLKKGGRSAGRGRRIARGSTEPQAIREPDRVTSRIAERFGISRATYERGKAVLKGDPTIAKRMISGELSVAGAAKKVKAQELKERGAAETSAKPGVLARLEDGVSQFRTVYADPPWKYGDEGAPGGGVAEQYSTMSVEQLEALNVGTLGHPEGSHLWMWTTWPMIRDRVPHRVLEAWGYRWVGEIVWVKPGLGVGRWMRPATEILILAVKGDPPLPLLRDDHKALLEAPKGRHSAKPEEAYDVIERLSPGPYVELFARRERQSWMRWGNEA